jgi:L-threonylcarbamoyladenylate synthase
MNRGTSIAAAVEALRGGGVIAYPTESVYGLGCDALDGDAVARLLILKGRSITKGLIVIGASLHQLEPLMHPLDREQREILETSWPAPVTWVVPAAADAPYWLTGGRNSIALRVPDHEQARALCREFRAPVVSTSANHSDGTPARSADELLELFPEGIDYLLDGPLGGRRQPSEIRDLVTGRILRPGGNGD